jgi:hypothetical protein
MAEAPWHYWLFEGEEGKPPFPVEDTDPKVFTSLDDARSAGFALERVIDIYRSPASGGMLEFVETVKGVTASDELKLAVEESVTKLTPIGWSITGRWRVHSREKATVEPHVRKLIMMPPSDPADPIWNFEVRDENDNILEISAGDDTQDAYLELWEQMKPPEDA